MSGIAREFSAVAGEYETNRLSPWYKAHAGAVLDLCPSLEQGDILDVGCGTGYFLRSFLRHNAGATGIGVDIAPGMIEQAERLADAEAIGNVRFIQGDWEKFDVAPLKDRPVKVAICANAFHYFSSPSRAARRMWEVLEEDGVLYVLERDKLRSPLTLLWGWLHRHCIRDNVKFYTREDLVSFFIDAGFGDVAVVRSINRLLWKNKLYTSVVLIECRKK